MCDRNTNRQGVENNTQKHKVANFALAIECQICYTVNMTQIKTSFPQLPQKLFDAFQSAFDSAKNEREKEELENMLRDAADKLAVNEMEGKEIAKKLSVSLNAVQRRMKKIRRVHNEKKDTDAESANIAMLIDKNT